MSRHSNKHNYLLHALQTRTDFNICWIWPFLLSKKGYGDYQYKRKTVRAHRESFRRFYDIDPGDSLVLHECDTPACFNPTHLFLGSNQDNMDDMNQKGRGNAGKLRPYNGRHWVKYNKEVIHQIREMYTSGLTQTQIGKLLQIDKRFIWQIVHYKSWKNAA